MTLLEQLQAHKGGLIQLKTQLYWYDRGSWDGTPGRICLLLDATTTATAAAAAGHSGRSLVRATRISRKLPATSDEGLSSSPAAFLLIDGQPQWIWVAEEDIALLVNDPPAN